MGLLCDRVGEALQHAPAEFFAAAACVEHRLDRGPVANTESSTLLEAEMLRQRHDIPYPNGRELGLAAKLRPCHHSLADNKPADIRTDGLDLAGDLVAQNARPFRRGGI